MSTPVILIGTDRDDGSLTVVGLYESPEAAQAAVQSGDLPSAHYSVMTPNMNNTVRRAMGTPTRVWLGKRPA